MKFETLERRNLLAAVNVIGGYYVTIDGTPGDDHLVIQQSSVQVLDADGGNVIEEIPFEVDSPYPIFRVSLGDGDDSVRMEFTDYYMASYFGGAGDDHIVGGDSPTVGFNVLAGQYPNWDMVYGEAGNDVLEGRDGTDFLYGDYLGAATTGNDTLIGGAGNDILFGGGGIDTIDGGSGHDTLFRQIGDDEDDVLNVEGTYTYLF